MFKNFDWIIFLYIILIFSLGLVILYSVVPQVVSQHLFHFAIGLILFFLFTGFDYRLFKNFSGFFYFLSIVLLLLTFLLGKVTRGALRWISLGSSSLQPSELVKPFLILSFSGLVSLKKPAKLKNFLFLLLLFLPPVFLIFFQPALGSTLTVFFIWLSIIFMAGVKLSHFFLMIFPGLGILPFIWHLLADYQKERILAFLNPGADPLGAGYHLIQSKITVGSGGLFGKGLGRGTQSHLRFLPEFKSDFIFAALSEELGLIGAGLLLLGYLLLLWRLLTIGQRSKDRFGLLIATGVFSMLFFQAFVNIGMNVGLSPITGITLPLVSSGGSSLVATLISLGLVESVAKVEKKRI
jgi:rod shape determining protein RodA